MIARKILALVMACLLFIAFDSCDDEDSPWCSSPPTPDATLENIWPNADSSSWLFSHLDADGEDADPDFIIVHPTREDVPPAPTFAEILPFLQYPFWPDSSESREGMIRLRFEGEMTTVPGVTAQRLSETAFAEQSTYPTAAEMKSFESALLERLWIVRPDLRERIRARMKAESPFAEAELGFSSMFLKGGAWDRTAERIGYYGYWDQNLAWKLLETDLTPGHGFTLQLIPDLAGDVFLHGMIIANGPDAETAVGTLEKTVQCAYLLDYGIAEAADDEGDPSGYYGMHDFAVVTYAPMVGPVHCYETRIINNGDVEERALGYIELHLVGSNVPWLSGR